MMKKAIYLLLIIGLAWTHGALAEGAECHEVGNYRVVTRPTDGAPGEDILVKQGRSKAAPCKYLPEAGDFELQGGDEGLAFYGLSGDTLNLDNGTGSSGRDIEILDIKTRKRVYSDIYGQRGGEEADISIEPNQITYWGDLRPPHGNECAREKKAWGGLDAAVATVIVVSLPDYKVTKTSKTHCVPQE
jgi:hypothetical protein